MQECWGRCRWHMDEDHCLRRRSCNCVWWLRCPPLQGTDQGGNLLRRLHAWDVLYHGLNVVPDELLDEADFICILESGGSQCVEEVMAVGSDEVVQYVRREDSGYELAICMRLLGCAALHGLSVELFMVVRVAILYGGDVLRGLGGLLAIASGWQFEVPVWVQRAQALLIGLP